MLGTTIRRKGSRAVRFTITAANGPSWVATPEDFGPALTLTVADLTSGAYVLEDGARVGAPDQRSPEAIEREAWARIGARSVGSPNPDATDDDVTAATLLTAAAARDAFDELRSDRASRGVLRATAEDHFVLQHEPGPLAPSEELRAEAAERVAADILRLYGREAVQAGDVPGIHARVLAAVRAHLKAKETQR